MFWHIDADFISLIVIIAIYVYQVKLLSRDGSSLQDKRFLRCLQSGVVITLVDIAASVIMEVPVNRVVYHVVMTLYYLMIELAILEWFFYAVAILYHDVPERILFFNKLLMLPYIVYAALVCSNPWTGLFFTLDANGAYQRGPLFMLMTVLFAIYAITLMAFVFVRRKHIMQGHSGAVIVLVPFILAAGIAVQLCVPGWLMILPAYMLCLVLTFLFLQTESMRSSRLQVTRLTQSASTDPLTGLLNRAGASALLDRSLAQDAGSGCAFAILDLDDLKSINDTLGHAEGDRALKLVAAQLRRHFRATDVVARYGGDEFLIYLTGVQNAAAMDRSFRQLIAGLPTLRIGPNGEYPLHGSLGAAFGVVGVDPFDQLWQQADIALYQVKCYGKNGYAFYRPEMRSREGVVDKADSALAASAASSDKEAGDGADGSQSRPERTLLVVDDVDVNRAILRKILGADYAVLEAENGAQALELLRARHAAVSAVLLDIVMPVMDGYEVLEAMRASTELANIPVIVTTANSDVEAEVKALSLGANDFIAKPYNPTVITHRILNTIRLREAAATVNAVERDPLTNLYSHAFFCKRAEELIRCNSGAAYQIICCDIARFKLVNELFGEKTGDELLQYVARIISEDMCGHGICGRLGGDHFAFLVQNDAPFTNAFFEAVSRRINQFPISMQISIRFGICTTADTSVSAGTLCDRALTACHSVKDKHGVYFAYYDDSFRERALHEQLMLDGLQRGIAQRQFLVYYQSKCSLTTHEIIGAEALVRWQHPGKGLLAPAAFVPLFERNGSIAELDAYVWETVCSDLHGWIADGRPPIPVSVNVSRADLYNPELPGILSGLVAKYDLPPRLLHLEVTESAYTEDSEQIIAMLANLRALGFFIEMDDFGTGYSSLNMLAQLPISVLKLDIRFLETASDDLRRKHILDFVIGLATKLRLPVIAEGVETAEQVRLLRGMGCGYAQGYFYSQPLPKDAFEAYLNGAFGQ